MQELDHPLAARRDVNWPRRPIPLLVLFVAALLSIAGLASAQGPYDDPGLREVPARVDPQDWRDYWSDAYDYQFDYNDTGYFDQPGGWGVYEREPYRGGYFNDNRFADDWYYDYYE